jgi:integrase
MLDLDPSSMNKLTAAQQQELIAATANHYAAQGVFVDFLDRKSDNTRRNYRANLETFATFLTSAQFVTSGEALYTEPEAWRNVSHGLVEAFVRWMLQQGYSISTVNLKLSTVKIFAKLAAKAGAMDATTKALIADVTGYSRKEAKKVDERRAVTRLSTKKAEHTSITEKQAEALKRQPETSQGHRDAVLMCLLLDHGLRAHEASILTLDDIDLTAGTMTFYRPKVDKVQSHNLSADTLRALRAYLTDLAELGEESGLLLRGSRRGGRLQFDTFMTPSNISKRVSALGEREGIERLSAHDCRHYWATYWAKRIGKLPKGAMTLQEAGGWSSLAMPRRYVEEATIANEGMS